MVGGRGGGADQVGVTLQAATLDAQVIKPQQAAIGRNRLQLAAIGCNRLQ